MFRTKCYLKHSWSILFSVALLFKEHVVNKKQCPEQCSLHPHVQVHRKVDAKVVRVGEHLPRNARPLLGDFAHLVALVGDDLELNVTADAKSTERSLDSQHRVSTGVLDAELGRKDGPVLLDHADHVAGWGRNFHLLQTARETARLATQRSIEV